MNHAPNNALALLCFAAICIGSFALIAAIIGAAVFFLTRQLQNRVTGDLGTILDEWAHERGYEVVAVGPKATGDHPFRDRFGFRLGSTPGIVHAVEMLDRQGRERHGWAYIRMRTVMGARGLAFGGYIAETLEIAWDD